MSGGARRLKVLHFISASTPSHYLCSFAEFIDRERTDFTIASLDDGRGPLFAEIQKRNTPTFALDCAQRKDFPKAIWKLARILRREKFDVIQVHLFDASLVGLTAANLARTPLKIFSGHHSHEIVLKNNRTAFYLDCLATRVLADRIIVHSLEMRDDLLRTEKVPLEKMKVVHLGFDLSHWRPSVAGRARVRAEFDLGDQKVLGAVGRLFWVKNYPILLEAFAQIARQRSDLTLLIVGDGPERASLEAQIARLGLKRRVILAGARKDIVDVMSAMDLFVHPSQSESFGQVIVEAFTLGKPMVATSVGIARELIENGQNGFLVPPGEGDSFARTLEKMIALHEKWPEMGREGQRRATGFSAQEMVAAHEKLYREWSGVVPA